MTKSDQNHYFKCKYSGNCHFTHTLWPNQTKIVTLNANTKDIVTLHTCYGQLGQQESHEAYGTADKVL